MDSSSYANPRQDQHNAPGHTDDYANIPDPFLPPRRLDDAIDEPHRFQYSEHTDSRYGKGRQRRPIVPSEH